MLGAGKHSGICSSGASTELSSPHALLHDIGRKRAALLDHRIKKVLEAALIRELRSSVDGVSSSETYGAKQGILGPQWQRPELYGTFYPAPGVSEAAE